MREDSVEANEWRRQAALMSEQREREQIAAPLSREIPQDPEVTGKAEASAVLPAEPEALIKKTEVENREGSPLTTPKPTAKTSSADSLSDQLPEPEPLDPRVQQTEASAEALRSVPKQTFPQMQVLAQMHGKYILAQDEHAPVSYTHLDVYKRQRSADDLTHKDTRAVSNPGCLLRSDKNSHRNPRFR